MTRSAQMIMFGLVAVLFGYFVLVESDGDPAGLLVGGGVAAFGAVLLQIGVIAMGVRMGLGDHFQRRLEENPARPWDRQL